jgi:hypothetical protein
MSRYARLSMLSLVCLTGCMVYPRFANVYYTPEYHGLVLDRDRQPVANVKVRFLLHLGQKPLSGRTNNHGEVLFPAQRHFEVLYTVFMDPPPFSSPQRVTWADRGSEKMDSLTRDAPYFYGSGPLPTVIADTIFLP